ncbi:amidohydrolase family protein [Variovorax sp. SRS16]|uniref:amidohydrolase family protein n=1 Tax=Variovorax sp. SRS16 TaxID=282217 RepID=UPI001E3C7329|nr:amidohydrolase family protein [Variovorax sp. SRS16]
MNPALSLPDRPLVDAHVHVFRSNMPLVPSPRHRPSYEFTAEQLQGTLDAHGVQYCVIAAASPWGDCNDYVIDSLRTRPNWRGTAILDPSTDRYILEQMARDGMVGVRLPFISMKQLPDLDSWDYRKFLYRLADMDWHVHLHLDGPRIPQVLPQLERSGVKIVLDHIGRPDPVAGVESEGFKAMVRSVEKGRTWVKLSGAYRLGPQATEHARELCRQVGYERMVWASDCPFVGDEATLYQSTIDWLAEVVPDANDRRRIGGENPLRLYFS